MVLIGSCARLVAPQSYRTKVNAVDGLTYLWIPPGEFEMGCSPGDDECFQWEPEAHFVTISKGFWIGQTEVTQGAYTEVFGTNPSRYRGPRLPADQLNWHEARTYCLAIGMRLPTEVEWEFAARGGAEKARYGALRAVAWFDENSGDSTHPAGQKQPNGYGLYDMLGNVWEWVEDAYTESGKDQRILRGGSFYNVSRDLRVSNRLWATTDTAHRNIGVRCAGE